LETEFKKLEHINKNIDRINKEKLLEYQKKMATLNNEINLTQNLYQSFIEAKSRAGKKA
jgi:16S rRNA G527 N7-methylase RsmG